MAKNILMDEDVFVELLWNYIPLAQEKFHRDYPDDVWHVAIETLASSNWADLKPEQMDPSYIIDNIAVNGDIMPVEDVMKEEGFTTDEEFEDYVNENGYEVIAGFLVRHWGI